MALGALAVAVAAGCAQPPTPASPGPLNTPSAAATTVATPVNGSYETITDYLERAGITQVQVKPGEPGVPRVDMPTPDGWMAAGARTPPWAFSAFLSADPSMAADPPTITTLMARLTGPVDAAEVLDYAPGELSNMPGFDHPGTAQRASLDGFEASQTGGTYVKDGVPRLIAQKTVVVPASDGGALYVLQINANGPANQWTPLLQATEQLDRTTKITP